jgi:Mn-dependent DtxR family transcriptional regulator
MHNTLIGNPETELAPKSIKFLSIPLMKLGGCPIRQRIVLAAIIYRTRINHGASVRWIARSTGYTWKTAAAYVKALEASGYISHRGDGWMANEPAGKMILYVWKKKPAAEWFNSIRTYKLPMPMANHGHKMPVVGLALYHSLKGSRSRQTVTGLANMLGVSRRSIQKSLAHMIRKGMIEMKPIFMTLESGERQIRSYDISVS